MIPTFKDIKTGKTAKFNREVECDVWWWTEGNGSCDCNRAYAFGEELVEELDKTYSHNSCSGCNRLICIDVEGDLEGFTKEELIEMLNEEYPEEARANLES
jgi:hypothetical protein